MKNITEIEGIGTSNAGKLQGVGVVSVENLLEKASSPKGRKELAEKAEISSKLLLRWVNMADLFRIKGVGEEYADLLEAVGVDTVPELSQRNPGNLHKKMEEINEAKKLVRRVPNLKEVTGWIEHAKTLPRKVTY